MFTKELLLEFDKQNITSSPQRKLDKCLLLLVQQKVGNAYYWIPPQGIRQDGESMRQVTKIICFKNNNLRTSKSSLIILFCRQQKEYCKMHAVIK